MFGQPFIDRLGVLPWLGSRMWFDLESSTIQPVSVSARVYDGAAPGFPAMRIEAGGIDSGLPGAFRLSCDWLLSRPYLAGSMPALLRTPMPPDYAGSSQWLSGASPSSAAASDRSPPRGRSPACPDGRIDSRSPSTRWDGGLAAKARAAVTPGTASASKSTACTSGWVSTTTRSVRSSSATTS